MRPNEEADGGWKTRSVFERYAIVTRTDISDAMRKLEAHERVHVTEKSRVLSASLHDLLGRSLVTSSVA